MILPLVGLLLAIWACGFSISPRIGARHLPVTQRPYVELRLAIQATLQYTSKANIGMLARVLEGADMHEVALADSVRVTCDGMAGIRNSIGILSLQCPRQQPGGSYRLDFSDGRGATTTVIVPVPSGTFAIVSPRAGATVPIPTDGSLAVRYTTPIPPAHGRVVVDNISAMCNLTRETSCGAVYATLHPAPTPTPDPNAPTATPFEIRVTPTPTPGAETGGTPIPNDTPVPTIGPPTPTVGMTQSGQSGVAYLTGDYSSFMPAPGILSMLVEVDEAPDSGGFAGVSVSYSDSVNATITWAR